MATELFQYFSVRCAGVLSVRDDGTTYLKTPWNPQWVLYSRKRDDVPLKQWTENRLRFRDEMKGGDHGGAWRLTAKMPTLNRLKGWLDDCYCMTPTGEKVEPDGVGTDGVESWALLLRLL